MASAGGIRRVLLNSGVWGVGGLSGPILGRGRLQRGPAAAISRVLGTIFAFMRLLPAPGL